MTFKDANACELATAKGKEKQDLGGKKVRLGEKERARSLSVVSHIG